MVQNKLLLKGAQNGLKGNTLISEILYPSSFFLYSIIKYLYKGRPARFVNGRCSYSTMKACNVNN